MCEERGPLCDWRRESGQNFVYRRKVIKPANILVVLRTNMFSLVNHSRFASPDHTDDGDNEDKESSKWQPHVEFQWQIMADMKMPRTRAAATVLHDEIYVVGGHGDDQCSMESYNIIQNVWFDRAPMNSWRFDVGVAAFKGQVYAAGGDYGSDFIDIVERYDPLKNLWLTVSVFCGLIITIRSVIDCFHSLTFADDIVPGQAMFASVRVE